MIENKSRGRRRKKDTTDIRDAGSIPGSGRSLGEEHGNLLQSSCLENAMHREAWWARVHRVAKSRTQPNVACATFIKLGVRHYAQYTSWPDRLKSHQAGKW